MPFENNIEVREAAYAGNRIDAVNRTGTDTWALRSPNMGMDAFENNGAQSGRIVSRPLIDFNRTIGWPSSIWTVDIDCMTRDGLLLHAEVTMTR